MFIHSGIVQLDFFLLSEHIRVDPCGQLLPLHFAFILPFDLILHLKLVVVDLLLGLQLDGLTEQGGLLALSFAVDGVLVAKVEVECDGAGVLGLEAEPVDDVALALFIDVFGAHDLLQFVDSD